MSRDEHVGTKRHPDGSEKRRRFFDDMRISNKRLPTDEPFYHDQSS